MHTDIEKIITELYAIDPSLKEHEESLRILVSEMIGAKPQVTIRENFVLNLRKSLQNRASTRVKEPQQAHTRNISWWAFRLAPIGVIAVLTLMLLPQKTESPTPYMSPVHTIDRDGAPTMDTYNTRTIAPEAGAPSTEMFKSSAPTAPANFSEQFQNPMVIETVSLERPGFAVVHAFSNGVQGEIVGVSAYLKAGQTVGVHINLPRAPYPDETFAVTFFVDNGDGLFTEVDTLVSNSSY